jgi:hypothetical protein
MDEHGWAVLKNRLSYWLRRRLGGIDPGDSEMCANEVDIVPSAPRRDPRDSGLEGPKRLPDGRPESHLKTFGRGFRIRLREPDSVRDTPCRLGSRRHRGDGHEGG